MSSITVANVVIDTVPGETATFGSYVIDGLDPDGNGPRKQEIQEPPLRRAIGIKAGQPYSTARIDDAVQALLDLEVFSAVEIVPDLTHPESRVVPLKVHLEPTRLRQVKLGGGIELDDIKTELHAITGWEDHNFFGGLRDFKVDFKPGVVLFPTRIDSLVTPTELFTRGEDSRSNSVSQDSSNHGRRASSGRSSISILSSCRPTPTRRSQSSDTSRERVPSAWIARRGGCSRASATTCRSRIPSPTKARSIRIFIRSSSPTRS